jgi:hypothetical protein
MASKCGTIGKNCTISNLTIMGNVRIVHKEAIITNPGKTVGRSSMDGGILAHSDAITHNHTSWLIFIAQVLRLQTD